MSKKSLIVNSPIYNVCQLFVKTLKLASILLLIFHRLVTYNQDMPGGPDNVDVVERMAWSAPYMYCKIWLFSVQYKNCYSIGLLLRYSIGLLLIACIHFTESLALNHIFLIPIFLPCSSRYDEADGILCMILVLRSFETLASCF